MSVAMHRKILAIGVWSTVGAVSFALGWMLNPASTPSEAMDDTGLATRSGVPLQTRRGGAWWDGPAGRRPRAGGPAAAPVRNALEAELPPLTSAAIEELGRQLEADLSPMKRRATFARLLAGLTAENALEIRAQIAVFPPRTPEWNDFHYAWGKIAGMEAVEHGLDTKEPDLRATVAGWASENPEAALDWFHGLADSSKESYASKNHVKSAIAEGLANSDIDEATAFVHGLTASGDEAANRMFGMLATKVLQADGPAEAAEWAESLPEGDGAAWAVHRIAGEYAGKDPEAAVGWASGLDDNPYQARALHAAFERWAGKDPVAATNYILDMPSSPNRDSAIGGLVSRHRWEDPVAAIAWANDISSPEMRQASLLAAGDAYFRKDPEGARQWLPASGLSGEARQKLNHFLQRQDK